MKKLIKNVCALCIVMTVMALSSLTAHAVSLSYSGGSSSNDTGAVATTSGFSISYTETIKNVCGYRFSVVTANGLPKSGTKVVNVFLSDVTEGTAGYSSADRFIISSGKIANKKQLANGTKVSTTTTVQSCDYKSGSCGFYSTLPQNPSSMGSWIKSTANSYQNLQRIYVLCGTNLSNATESDYVLIEPLFRPALAGRRTVATATELAVYGAAVSGGDGYSGGNGNLYNAGSGTLWNLMNYVNREFPNALYVSEKTDVYGAATIKTSSKYTYKEIIQNGLGCSVLTVKNVVPINKVYVSYHANGGTSNTTYPINQNGWLTTSGSTYIHSLTHGKSTDPYNATTFGLTKAGYHFGGWKVNSTGQILNQDTGYASTVYAQYNDSSKTTANTATVYCHLYAVWIPNVVYIAYHPNGGTTTKSVNSNGYILNNSEYFHSINYGSTSDPFNASSLALTRTGYTFKGWKIQGTNTVLNQDTIYDSTMYSQYDNSSKTTANTTTVYCRLFAQWEKNTYTNTIEHWALGFKNTGNNEDKTEFLLASKNYTKQYGDVFTLTASDAVTVPRGFVLRQNFGTRDITGSWMDFSFGTSITQPASSMHFEYKYYPMIYTVVYDLAGGVNHADNPNSYTVLDDITLKNPTKENHTFMGWTQRVKTSMTIQAASKDWNYSSLLHAVEPGKEYHINIGSAKLISGAATQFACAIYDMSGDTLLVNKNINFGDDLTFDITCPATADASHDIRILLYAGVRGSTSGNEVQFNNITVQFSATGINEGSTSSFTDAEDLYEQMKRRMTGTVELVAEWSASSNILIVPIEPNAPYRENTEVLTSFWLVNVSNKDYTQYTGAGILFRVYDESGQVIAASAQAVVVPKNEKNLVYFLWKVPDGIALEVLSVKAYIQDSGNKYSHVENNYTIAFFEELTTPDTEYEDKAPDDFSVPTPVESDVTAARWWRWVYNNGAFVKKEYAVHTWVDELTLLTPTNPSAYTQNGILHMKSGYGFECRFAALMATVTGYDAESALVCAEPQYLYAQFPEYNYTYSETTCRSFQKQSGLNTFIYLGSRKRQHFTPIYYPDGPYEFQIVLSDCWTPAGMLTTYHTVTIKIEGNMYDDWYIGRK